MSTPDARRFVILLGWVSLFADLCYEGMRSAIGPVPRAARRERDRGRHRRRAPARRSATGYATSRGARRPHAPLLGAHDRRLRHEPRRGAAARARRRAGRSVAVLVGVERLGKAIRSPAKSTLTSFAAADLGAGKAFAIAEAMDQTGALSGPLAVAGVLAWRGHSATGFAWAFALLAVPAVVHARDPVPRARGCTRIRTRWTSRATTPAARSGRATGSTSPAWRSSRRPRRLAAARVPPRAGRRLSARRGCRSRTPPRWRLDGLVALIAGSACRPVATAWRDRRRRARGFVLDGRRLRAARARRRRGHAVARDRRRRAVVDRALGDRVDRKVADRGDRAAATSAGARTACTPGVRGAPGGPAASCSARSTIATSP